MEACLKYSDILVVIVPKCLPQSCDWVHISTNSLIRYVYGRCKVEFNQPSCWLYSVPNLLIFQQLETLYLGGNHVRVVCMRKCKELLKCVQRSRDSRLDLVGGSQLQTARLKHTCQACQKLKHRTSCSLQDKSSRLARPFARSSHQNTLFGKI